MQPTALGELGATMAQTAGIALATRAGKSLGKNPSGDLLPAFTPTDKAFVDAYSAQAEATLGIQAQSLMTKGIEQLNQSYKLSPGQIESFHANMAQGLQGILDHAPNTVKTEMENQFQQQLISQTHGATMKMINQNKEIAQSQASVYTTHQLQQMHDAQLSGNNDLAKQIYSTILRTNNANLASGMLSPAQADTANTTAKLSYYSSVEIQKALAARNNHQLEGFLADMVNTKPSELGWSEWEDVRNKTVGYIGAVENLDNRDQSLIMSQAQAQASIAPLTPDYIANLKTQLSPTRFNNFMAHYGAGQKSQYAKQQSIAAVQANWHDTRVTGFASPEILNQSFGNMVEAAKVRAQNQGIALSDDDAQLEVASTAGSPVPIYIQKLNKGLQSGNPQLMMRDWQDYLKLKQSGGQLAAGVSKESIAMGTMMNHFLEEGMDPTLAAQRAQEVIMNKTPEVRENNLQLIKDWRMKTVKDAAHRDTWARSLAGISKGTFISNGNGFALHVQNIMEDNLALTNGNVIASEQMLKDAIQQYWGTTEVNGEREFTYMPIEKAINLDKGAGPLIRSDVMHQLNRQIEATNKAHEAGNLPFYYRIKSTLPTYDEYLKAKNEVRQKQTIAEYGKALFEGKPTDLKSQFDIISKFESNAPIEIELVHNGGEVETYKVNVAPSPMMQQSSGELPVIGDYDLTMRNDKGANFPLAGAFLGQQNHPVYRPNVNWIRDNYFAVNGIDPTDSRAKFLAMQRFERKPKEQMAFLRSIQ